MNYDIFVNKKYHKGVMLMNYQISDTKKAAMIMVDILKSKDGKAIRHKDLEAEVKGKGDFSQGHINGAFNYLRSGGESYGVIHERVSGKSYFRYVGQQDDEKNHSLKKIIDQKTAEFLDQLADMKKEVDTVDEFELLQSFIKQVQDILNSLENNEVE